MEHTRHVAYLLALLLLVTSCADRHSTVSNQATTSSAQGKGARIYRDQCARCHGPTGEGVAGKHDEPLYGERSLESLARQIERTMPEDKVGTCVGEDAQAVAAYIHTAFYSPAARARNNPVKIDLARLTIRQHRESFADLVGSFLTHRVATTNGGLHAEYFQSKGMNKKERRSLERTDATIDFAFGEGSPAPDITADQFSIAWAGSLLAPDTGDYQFRLTTPNGARLYLNTDLAAGDANRRDDSDAKRQPALVDLWVSSGGMVREGLARLFLLGGRSYPLRLDYFKFKEKTAAIKLEWKPPHGVWSVVPAEVLSPERSSSVAVISTSFPPDDSSVGYERGTSISKAWLDAATKAAVEGATYIDDRLDALAGTSPNDTNRVVRLKAFVATLAERAFRRPLTPEQRLTVVDEAFGAGVAPELAVKRAVMRVLGSPHFLYPELGQSTDPYTVASRLAMVLWDSLPDSTLREAANEGRLGSRPEIGEQARRMMADSRARAKLQEFFHHWLALDEAEDLTKDPKTYPGFNESIRADLRMSLQRFIDHVVWSESADYRQLLLADYLFLNPSLAEFYGASMPTVPGFLPVTFDPSQRVGIFTHPYLLAAFSYHKSSSPIHRGVFLTRNVLGRFLKPPPMAIEFMDDRFDPSLTMREKVTQLTSKETCMACHATINPLGFSLEQFDAVGRFRTVDNRKPVNAESEYTAPDGKVLHLRGPRDLAEHAATNPEARRGFVRQLFQFSVKQAPAAYGSETLPRLDSAFVKSGHHMREALAEIATTVASHGVRPHTASR